MFVTSQWIISNCSFAINASKNQNSIIKRKKNKKQIQHQRAEKNCSKHLERNCLQNYN